MKSYEYENKCKNHITIIKDGEYVNLEKFTYLGPNGAELAVAIHKFDQQYVINDIKRWHIDVESFDGFYLSGCRQERNGIISLGGYTIAKHKNGMYKIFSFIRNSGSYNTYGLNYDFTESLSQCKKIVQDLNGHLVSNHL